MYLADGPGSPLLILLSFVRGSLRIGETSGEGMLRFFVVVSMCAPALVFFLVFWDSGLQKAISGGRKAAHSYMTQTHMDNPVLKQYGAAGLVSELSFAVQGSNKLRVVQLCAAIIKIKDIEDNVTVHRAGGASALADVLEAFPDDAIVTQTALGALFQAWGGAVPPFSHDASHVPTKRVVQAIVDTMQRHPGEIHTAQAGMRLFKLYTASANRLTLLPVVVQALERAMTAFPDDESVKHWGATAMCHLAVISRASVVAAHGDAVYESMRETILKLAGAAKEPTTFFVDTVPWHAKIIEMLTTNATND